MKVSNKELLEISVNIEREAQAFYEELASHISEPMISNYLLLMAKDEAHHEKQFESILGEKGGQKYGWENSAALRELIDKHLKPGLFPPLEGVLKNLSKFEGVQKALTIAQKCEELAVKFYGTLRENCEDFETKALLITLESEEKHHCDFIQTLIKYWEKQPGCQHLF
jgi:rubrerythrin